MRDRETLLSRIDMVGAKERTGCLKIGGCSSQQSCGGRAEVMASPDQPPLDNGVYGWYFDDLSALGKVA